MSAIEYALGPGDKVGQYEILSSLGAGGFGITYLAYDPRLDRKVALKEFFPEDFARRRKDGRVVPRDESASETFDWALERFSDEARTLARFSHPNIVRVNQLLPDVNGTAYIVMDYIEGVSLKASMVRDGLPSPERILAIFDQLLDGCEAIHRNGILHRDINPSNVMMRTTDLDDRGRTETGELKKGDPIPVLIDFGASRQVGLQRKSAIATPGYSPPEQYSANKAQTEASDIYALAATVHHMLTGQAPPNAAARHEEPLAVVPRDRAEAFRPEFLPALLEGLQLNLAGRPQSIEAWRKKLGPLKVVADPTSKVVADSTGRRSLLIGAGLASIALAGGGIALLGRSHGLSGSARPFHLAWSKDFGTLAYDDPFGQIAITPTGCAVAANRLGDDGNARMLGIGIDSAGALAGEWVDDAPGGRAHAILPMPDGGILVGGTVGDTAVLARLGKDWRPIWRRDVGAGAVKSILPAANGVVIGLEEPESSGAPLIALNHSGDLVWRVNIDKGSGEAVERMVLLAKGGYAVLGSGLRVRQTAAGDMNESYTWVAILDDQGKVKNRPQTTGMGAAFGWGIVEVDGVLYVTGRTSDGRPDAPPRVFMWAIDPTGVELWARWDYPGVPSSGRGLALADKNTLYLSGWSGNPSHVRFSQIGPNGNLVWDSTQQTTANVAALGLAMRGPSDGYCLATAKGSGEQNRLLISRLASGGIDDNGHN
ncbi:MAG: serine/threonine-protein kinase [bacterium]|jgi:tRNA A-37 threonylcarbamoyl transferase component Bud32